MRYLQGTKDYMSTYRRSNCLEVKRYTDYGGCSYYIKSTSGCIFTLAKGVVSWKSVKHLQLLQPWRQSI